MAGKRIGILAMQGAFIEHQEAIEKCGAQPILVRNSNELMEIDGLIIPGGESTSIGILLSAFSIDTASSRNRQKKGLPIWGTCAGMILLAKDIIGSDQPRLGLMDIVVKRNAFGRQVESFETELNIAGLGYTKGVFIRAPYVEKVGNGVEVLAKHRDKIVMVKEKQFLATAFHPELTDRFDMHKFFLDMV
ncbi:MAG: pyridoxal 5'-phosphate synthase glutaminase subunit PdxT [Syntrophomonadaceae bacterium]